jgi:hypothetical protein
MRTTVDQRKGGEGGGARAVGEEENGWRKRKRGAWDTVARRLKGVVVA